MQVWPYVALPALKLLLPRMRPGAVVVTDNVIHSAAGYKDLFEVLRDPNGDFRSVTLPYSGGLEMSVYWPKGS
jgi:predicted O-methyltransferase YrrM